MKNEMRKKFGNLLIRFGRFLDRHAIMVALVIVCLMSSGAVFASPTPPPTAETMWDNVMHLIVPWIARLGGVIILVGGVMFGLGFKNDDAEQKSRGLNVIISGAIVLGVAGAADTFIW